MRGRGGFGGRGGGRGRGRGRGRGGFNRAFEGPPETVWEMGLFTHACEGQMVCKSTNEKVPYFNAPIYLENKTQIGKVDEIFGGTTDVMFTVKCNDGVVATSFKDQDKVYISPDKLLPMARFLPQPKGAKSRGGGRGGRGGRGGFGGRGGGRGGFGGRGGGRGGFGGRGGGRGGFGGRGGGRGGFGGRGGGRGGFGGRGGGRGGFGGRGGGRGGFGGRGRY